MSRLTEKLVASRKAMGAGSVKTKGKHINGSKKDDLSMSISILKNNCIITDTY